MQAMYFIRLRGNVLGPYTLSQLQALKAQGKLSGFHEVSEDRAEWVPASSLTELFAPAQAASTHIQEAPVATPVRQPDSPAAAGEPTRWLYMDDEDKQRGPVTTDELRQLLRDGRVSRQTHVWQAGMAEWKPLAACAGLAPPAAGGESAITSWERRVQWGRTRVGLTLLLTAAGVVVANLVLTAFGGLVAWLGRGSAGLVFTFAVYFGLGLVAKLVAAAGHAFCAAVPPASGARGFGVATLVAALAHLALLLFPLFLLVYALSVVGEPLDVQLRTSVAVAVLNGLAWLLYHVSSVARDVLSMLYLRAIADHLRATSIATGCKYALLLYLGFVATIVMTGLAAVALVATAGTGPRTGPRDAVVLVVVFFGMLTVTALLWLTWFFVYSGLVFKVRGLVAAQAPSR